MRGHESPQDVEEQPESSDLQQCQGLHGEIAMKAEVRLIIWREKEKRERESEFHESLEGK